MRISVTRQYLNEKEKKATAAVLESGWLAQESRIAEFDRMG